MVDKRPVWLGTLALMVLNTLDSMGPLHAYGLGRRIEQISGESLNVNYGTLYPALLRLEQEGFVSAEWGASENGRKAKFYSLTKEGRKELKKQSEEWQRTVSILSRFVPQGGSR